jgi:hypothetical protein
MRLPAKRSGDTEQNRKAKTVKGAEYSPANRRPSSLHSHALGGQIAFSIQIARDIPFMIPVAPRQVLRGIH